MNLQINCRVTLTLSCWNTPPLSYNRKILKYFLQRDFYSMKILLSALKSLSNEAFLFHEASKPLHWYSQFSSRYGILEEQCYINNETSNLASSPLRVILSQYILSYRISYKICTHLIVL